MLENHIDMKKEDPKKNKEISADKVSTLGDGDGI